MSCIVQPAVAKRIAFATWARKNHIAKKSSVTYVIPEGVEVPETLMLGAQVDGKAVPEKKTASTAPKPRRTRVRKTKDRGVVEEPGPPLTPEQEKTTEEVQAAQQAESDYVFNPVDYPQHQEASEAQQEE